MSTVCLQNGWTENNRPVCAGCRNPIGVRGDTPGNAVLVGEALELQVDGEVVWVAHFDCRRFDWRAAARTLNWWERDLPGDRKAILLLLTDRPAWAEKEPWIVGA
jgi:hypothetical protein